MLKIGDHAAVVGGSMGGLLAGLAADGENPCTVAVSGLFYLVWGAKPTRTTTRPGVGSGRYRRGAEFPSPERWRVTIMRRPAGEFFSVI